MKKQMAGEAGERLKRFACHVAIYRFSLTHSQLDDLIAIDTQTEGMLLEPSSSSHYYASHVHPLKILIVLIFALAIAQLNTK